MAIRMPRINNAKHILRRSLSGHVTVSSASDIPKGCFPVYVGEQEKKWVVIQISFLNHPAFQELSKSEEGFGFDHPLGGLTIPCREDIFVELASRLS